MLGLIDAIFSRERVHDQYVPAGAQELSLTLARGDYGAAEKALASSSDHDWRHEVFDYLARSSERRQGVAAWFRASKGEGQSLLAEGVARLHAAWEARGDAWVPKDVPNFLRGLSEADQLLAQASNRWPSDPVPYAPMLAATRGLQRGYEATSELVARSKAQTKGAHWCIARQLVQNLAPKWEGPPGAMVHDLMAYLASIPPGDPAHAMTCSAAVELVYMQVVKNNRFDPEVFNTSEIRGLVSHAQTYWGGVRARRPHTGDRFAHGCLGFMHWITGNTTLAEPHIRAIYPHFCIEPWAYFGRPVAMARRAAKECGVR